MSNFSFLVRSTDSFGLVTRSPWVMGVNKINEGGGAVVLPCSNEDFTTFIRSLLGKPQTYDQDFLEKFVVTRESISDLNALLEQRISQQNGGRLTAFSVQINFSDNSSQTMNSLIELKSFAEVSGLSVYSLILSWKFLITFADKLHPELQEIDISFFVHGLNVHYVGNNPFIENIAPYGGLISLSIKHTARSWAIDIARTIEGFINNNTKKTRKYKKILYVNSGKIGLTLSVMVYAFGFFSGLRRTDEFVKSTTVAAEKLTIPANELDWLVNFIASGTWPRFLFNMTQYHLGLVVVSIVISVIVIHFSRLKEYSHILFSQKSEERKEKLDKKETRSVWGFILSILLAIGCSMVANFISKIIS